MTNGKHAHVAGEMMNADTIVKGLLTIIMGVFAWLGADAMKRLHHLENDAVRKADMKELKEQLAGEHEENRDNLKSATQETRDGLKALTDAVTGTHKRIDDFLNSQMEQNRR